MNEELKPCPFCGGKAEIVDFVLEHEYENKLLYYVRCSECTVETDSDEDISVAKSIWNTRVETSSRGIWLQHDAEEANAWECSLCHHVWQLMDGNPDENKMNYCTNCGAKMEKMKPVMKNNTRFFRNTDCEYFPCHKVDDTENFNCLFCFCPLYHMVDCPGSPEYLPNGIKDCSNCTLPHKDYEAVIEKLKKEVKC